MSLPIATLGSAVVTVVTLLMLSQFLTPTEFGTLMLITGTGQFVSVMAFEWLRLCALRYGGRESFDDLRIRELYLAIGLLIVAAMAVLAILQGMSIVDLPVSETLAYALCLGLSDGVAAYLRARGHFSMASVFWLARSLLGLLAGLAFAWLGADGATASIALGLSYLVAVVPVIARLGLALQLRMTGSLTLAPKLFQFGAPLMLAGLMNTSVAAAARALVAVTAGVAAAGAFALIWELVSKALGSAAAAVTSTSLRGLVVANDGGDAASEKAGAYQNYAVAVLAVTLPAALGLVTVSNELTTLLLPAALWTLAERQFPWIVVGCFALVTKTFLIDSVFFASERPFLGAVTSVAGVLATGAAAFLGYLLKLEAVATAGSAVAVGCLVATAMVLGTLKSSAARAPSLLRGVVGVGVAGMVMVLATLPISWPGSTYLTLTLRVVTGVISYATAVLALDRIARTGIVAATIGSLRRAQPVRLSEPS